MTSMTKNFSTGALDKYFFTNHYKDSASSECGSSITAISESSITSNKSDSSFDFLPSTHKTVLWTQTSLISHQDDDNSDVDSIISLPRECSKPILWQQIPKVVESGILKDLSPTRLHLQEAIFEVITTEANYLKKLRILINHFVRPISALSQEASLIGMHDWKYLFELVSPVKEASERFLADLGKRWQSDVISFDISDIVYEHASKNFDVFVSYCKNQNNQERCLEKLKNTNEKFLETLTNLESNPICENQPLQSYLILPVQRITRLHLLVKTILKYSPLGTGKYNTWSMVSDKIAEIANECEDQAKETIGREEMVLISNQLDFENIKSIPILSASRHLVKKGEVQSISFNLQSKGSSRVAAKQKNYKRISLFLFSDLLLIAKAKSNQENRYTVVTYCARNMVIVSDIAENVNSFRNAFYLFLLQSHTMEQRGYFIICCDQLDKQQWYDNLFVKDYDKSSTTECYEDWDCPQVKGLYDYDAQKSDELSIKKDDVMKVYVKQSDGWYFGMRVDDGLKGWFPGNYSIEIPSVHIRARKLRESFRSNHLRDIQTEEVKEKKSNGIKRRSHFYVMPLGYPATLNFYFKEVPAFQTALSSFYNLYRKFLTRKEITTKKWYTENNHE